jgi:hypothetical protein
MLLVGLHIKFSLFVIMTHKPFPLEGEPALAGSSRGINDA